MCTNSRFIWNPYARKRILVKCGKCDACKQEKAFARSFRIRNNVTPGSIALFITLTYTNDFVPYVKKSDIFSSPVDLPVYRRCKVREVYDRHSDVVTFRKYPGEYVSSTIPMVDVEDKCVIDDSFSYKHLVGMPDDCIGVCIYKDVQKFYKRLRQNLIRKYNYVKSFSMFSVTEYGSHTYRPHVHALIFIGRDDERTFRSAIVESWPYADRRRTAKFIEIARDAASYVSSYVNSNLDLYPLLQVNQFMPKHTSSKDFGVVLECFSLPEILKKIDSGDLVYYREKKFDGESCSVAVPIPRYVLYRYFPILKGFSWLDSCQLRSILLNPERIGDLLTDFQYECSLKFDVLDYDFRSKSFEHGATFEYHHIPVVRQASVIHPLYHFTPQETRRMYVRLENCYQRFHRETGLSRFDYAFYYVRCWSLYSATLERCLHELFAKLQLDYSEFYENCADVIHRPGIAPTLLNLDLQVDPNKRRDIIVKTEHFRSLYSRLNKQKKVTNFVMSQMDLDV